MNLWKNDSKPLLPFGAGNLATKKQMPGDEKKGDTEV